MTTGVKRARSSFLVFGSPLIGEPEIEEVIATLRSGWIGTGPRVAKFEAQMSEYTGAEHSIAVSSCTAALHLSMLALGIGPGDEVVTTPMTFAATANAIVHTGAKPVFVDVNRKTMLIDPQNFEAAITPRTKAIIPVHLAGRPCPMDEIISIARKYGIYVVEDAAHCIEGRYHGERIGNIGDLTCFSFYVTKNLTTAEGGMVATNNKEWADKIRSLGLHGMDKDAYKRFSDTGYKHYQVIAPGYKYNMTDIQAALGIHQLQRIEASWVRRNEIWDYYQSALSDLPVVVPLRTKRMSVTLVICIPFWCMNWNAARTVIKYLARCTNKILARGFTIQRSISIPTITKHSDSVKGLTQTQSGSAKELFRCL